MISNYDKHHNKTKTSHTKKSHSTPSPLGTLPRAELRRIVAEMVG